MLLLFDIDGTLLLRASREHAEALYAAIREVHGVAVEGTRVSAAGRTDGWIARALLQLAGVADPEIDAAAAEVERRTCEAFAERCPDDLSAFVSPGVADVLARLAERDTERLALLTGNFESVGRLKVERAGLGAFFPVGQGAFGSDAEDRDALPAIARRRAAPDGEAFPREQTVVIGDTPLDIACARSDGVHVVAVATGPFAAGELAGADAVAHDAPGILASLDALPVA